MRTKLAAATSATTHMISLITKSQLLNCKFMRKEANDLAGFKSK